MGYFCSLDNFVPCYYLYRHSNLVRNLPNFSTCSNFKSSNRLTIEKHPIVYIDYASSPPTLKQPATSDRVVNKVFCVKYS